VVVKATTGTVAGIGVGALGVVAVSTCRGNGNKAVIGARTQPVTQILLNALGPVVTTVGVHSHVVGLACAPAVAGVGVGALGVTIGSAGLVHDTERVAADTARRITGAHFVAVVDRCADDGVRSDAFVVGAGIDLRTGVTVVTGFRIRHVEAAQPSVAAVGCAHVGIDTGGGNVGEYTPVCIRAAIGRADGEVVLYPAFSASSRAYSRVCN